MSCWGGIYPHEFFRLNSSWKIGNAGLKQPTTVVFFVDFFLVNAPGMDAALGTSESCLLVCICRFYWWYPVSSSRSPRDPVSEQPGGLQTHHEPGCLKTPTMRSVWFDVSDCVFARLIFWLSAGFVQMSHDKKGNHRHELSGPSVHVHIRKDQSLKCHSPPKTAGWEWQWLCLFVVYSGDTVSQGSFHLFYRLHSEKKDISISDVYIYWGLDLKRFPYRTKRSRNVLFQL